MKSVKRGRGPSMMDGVMSVFMGVFGVVWTIGAAQIGGGFFALFGVVFIGIAIVQAVYAFSNATGKQRFSEYDITEQGEEPDPLNVRFGAQTSEEAETQRNQFKRFCPYCGEPAQEDHVYCSRCGKKLA